jgi:GNAT superfamily N-acetyltransferase
MCGMRWHAEPDPAALLDRAGSFLESDPLRHNVLCTLLAARRAGHAPVEPDGLWLYGREHGAIAAVATCTPPRGLLLSAMSEPAAVDLARYVAARRPTLPSVDGPTAPADACAAEYARITGRRTRPGLHNRLMVLDRLALPPGVPGDQRPLRPADQDLVVGWLVEFAAEALPDQPVRDRRDLGAWLAGREGHLWEDGGEPVSLLMMSVPVAGVRRIGPVYTPPERRGRGYAAANVATASRRALDTGTAGLMLYADAANPVSNRVYERIGYRVLDGSREWLLAAPSTVAAASGATG